MILRVEFEEAVWQRIVDMLAAQPMRDVYPIIMAINQQFAEQRPPAGSGNGELRPEGPMGTLSQQ